MKIKGIIFDLDGTLLYTLEDLKNSVNYALQKNNLNTITLENTRQFVGNGVYKLIERAVGDKKEYTENCFKIFKEHYEKNSKITTKPYPNIINCLNTLKDNNIKLAVLSNKLDDAVKELVDYYFKNLFDIAIGECPNFPKKPDCKAANYIIEKFNLKKEEILLIGDSEVDIETAKNSGVKCLSVSWGYKDKNFLIKNGAEKIIDKPYKILESIGLQTEN